MGKIKSILFIALILLLIYFFARGIASWRQGYSWSEMDWNQKGSTSLIDFFIASDIGEREITINGKPCFEYYAYKDGINIKTQCTK